MIPKKTAIKLINEKIVKFQEILNVPYSKTYDDTYHYVYQGTIMLLKDIFPKGNEDWRFVHEVGATRKENYLDDRENTLRYQDHIKSCIAELKMAKDRLKYLPELVDSSNPSITNKVAFVAKSFHKSDRDLNEYFEGILKALNIPYLTAERYSKDSVPVKVENRIAKSNVIIVIFVKRYTTVDGKFLPPNWLIKEEEQKEKRQVIALVEEGLTELAGLENQKELIYFKRNNHTKMKKATITFLEALKEHGLV